LMAISVTKALVSPNRGKFLYPPYLGIWVVLSKVLKPLWRVTLGSLER